MCDVNNEIISVTDLEIVIERLEYHLGRYNDYKSLSENAGKKADRERAFGSMCTSAQYLQSELCKPQIYPLISDGNQYQFEDFYKYANSDVPDYIKKLKEELERRVEQ